MTGPRRAGVLGSPIGHSLSPVLHRAAYLALGLDWGYDAYDVPEGGLRAFLADVDESWAGLSLTMPLKTEAVGLVDEISERARLVGAVNTIIVSADGLIGHNTDVPGMIRALDSVAVDRDAVRSVSIIGAGATARSALAAVIERQGPSVLIDVYARSLSRARGLVELGDALDAQVSLHPWEEVPVAWQADLVVSTLPGPAAEDISLPPELMPKLLMDVAYDPWPTALATRWRTAGGQVASGADLLLGQALDQVELMTGREAPAQAMREALFTALSARADGAI